MHQAPGPLEAFAAIRGDGSVVTWGDPDYGGDCSAVQPLSLGHDSAVNWVAVQERRLSRNKQETLLLDIYLLSICIY